MRTNALVCLVFCACSTPRDKGGDGDAELDGAELGGVVDAGLDSGLDSAARLDGPPDASEPDAASRPEPDVRQLDGAPQDAGPPDADAHVELGPGPLPAVAGQCQSGESDVLVRPLVEMDPCPIDQDPVFYIHPDYCEVVEGPPERPNRVECRGDPDCDFGEGDIGTYLYRHDAQGRVVQRTYDSRDRYWTTRFVYAGGHIIERSGASHFDRDAGGSDIYDSLWTCSWQGRDLAAWRKIDCQHANGDNDIFEDCRLLEQRLTRDPVGRPARLEITDASADVPEFDGRNTFRDVREFESRQNTTVSWDYERRLITEARRALGCGIDDFEVVYRRLDGTPVARDEGGRRVIFDGGGECPNGDGADLGDEAQPDAGHGPDASQPDAGQPDDGLPDVGGLDARPPDAERGDVGA